MGIPIGYNIKREEDQEKERDVLRADVTGQRSPIRRRIGPERSYRRAAVPSPDFHMAASRDPILRARLAPPPPVPEVSRNAPRMPRYQQYASLRTMLANSRPLPALTPGFAPASASRSASTESEGEAPHGARNRTSSAGPRRRRSRSPQTEEPAYRRRDTTEPREDGYGSLDSGADSHAVGFPPLRRMGRRTVTRIITDGPLPSSSLRGSWSPVSTLDGLGDRERSVSPLEESLPWHTFLSTVVPDPVAPTADSSFASAAASASFSNASSNASSRAGSANSRSASSSRTHLTVPSRRQSESQFMRACESSSDTEDDTEDDDEMIVRLTPASLRRRARPSYFSSEPPMRDTERYSHRVLERSRAANAYVSRFYHARTATDRRQDDLSHGPLHDPAEATTPTSDEEDILPLVSMDDGLDQELRDARSLLERLTRRDDVRDDFWTSVGLTRSFADRVESIQDRE